MKEMYNSVVGVRTSVVEKMRAVKSRRETLESSPTQRGCASRDAMKIHQIYSKERRRLDYDYEARPTPGKYARKAAAILKDRHVDPAMWTEYVRDCFEAFARMNTGSSFAPMSFVSSESMIDRFAARQPARPINMRKLKKFLDEVGSKEDPALVASIMRTAMESGRDLPTTMPLLLRRSVMLAMNSFKTDIGFEPLGE